MSFKRAFEDWRYAFGWITSAVVIVAILLSVFLVLQSRNSLRNQPYPNIISVTGKGEIIAIPDVATFDFSVAESSESVESAQKIATEKINKALSFLKENGIEEKDLKTTAYNIYPKYEWRQSPCTVYYCPGGENVLIGYEVSQTISVKVRETVKAGGLLAGIGGLGVPHVGGLIFTTDEVDKVKEEAKKMAIEDAKTKAKDLADSLGVKLVRIVSFGENDYGGYDYYGKEGYGGDMMSKVSAAPSPELPAGEQKITSTVYISYEIR